MDFVAHELTASEVINIKRICGILIFLKTNDERVHDYQRRRTMITGLGL
jgi:hypothetical protein